MKDNTQSARELRALAILAGFAANPEVIRIDQAHLVENAIRLADMLAARLAVTAPAAPADKGTSC